jgi:hypothetical protein
MMDDKVHARCRIALVSEATGVSREDCTRAWQELLMAQFWNTLILTDSGNLIHGKIY